MTMVRNFLAALLTCMAVSGFAASPYEPSQLITDVTFDWNTLVVLAPGSDNWPITWAADGHQYTIWGDGGGFRGTNQNCRASLGIARIEGSWQEYQSDPLAHAFNAWGCNGNSSVCEGPALAQCASENAADFTGKSYGIISVNGTLYAWWGPGSGNAFTAETRVMRSTDFSASWSRATWSFERSDNLYGGTFLNFGRDNAAAIDGYVYSYFPRGSSWQLQAPGQIDLARVPADSIMIEAEYEWFIGINQSGNPQWSSDITARQSVFVIADGLRLASVTYNPGLNRFLLSTHHADGDNNLAIFDGPTPWGPWTTVAYLDDWGLSEVGSIRGVLAAYLAPKWFSEDGRDFSIVYTHADNWASLRGRFSTATQDGSPPSTVANLTSVVVSENSITLTWDAAIDPETGILRYLVLRDGVEIAQVVTTEFEEAGLSESTQYNYEVVAVNGGGLRGPAASLSVTTLADRVPPRLVVVNASAATSVSVVFSEPVDPTSAENVANYGLDRNATVTNASIVAGGTTVVLITSELMEGTTYALTVENVQDEATVPNMIAFGTQASFEYRAIPVARLVAHWAFEDNTLDATGQNDGTIVGPELYDRGVSGQAINLDGSYIVVANNSNLDDLGAFSYASWILPHVSGDLEVVSKAGSTKELRLTGGTSQTQLRGCVVAQSANACSNSLPGSIQINRWQHVAMIYDDSGSRVVRLFIDGNEVTYQIQTVAVGNITSDAASVLEIGRRTTGDRPFDGLLDELRIYDRALTAGEVSVLAQANTGLVPKPPVLLE